MHVAKDPLIRGLTYQECTVSVEHYLPDIFFKKTEYQLTDESFFNPEASWMKYVISKCYHIFYVIFIFKVARLVNIKLGFMDWLSL